MRRLILIRHAKSSWDDPRLADYDRVLNSRGIRACGLIGGWLAENDILPDEAIVSAAARTRETWTRVSAALGEEPPLRSEIRLYHADPERMHGVLTEAAGETVAMVGHNPGIAEFAARLLPLMPEDREFRRFPTAATAVIDFPVDDWRQVTWNSGRLFAFTVPKRLG